MGEYYNSLTPVKEKIIPIKGLESKIISNLIINRPEQLSVAARILANERAKHLTFARVANEVLLVNGEVNPFNFAVGQDCPLGVFAKGSYWPEDPSTEQDRTLIVKPPHYRSAILGRIFFADQAGRVYRDIDLKGVGSFVFLSQNSYTDTDVGKSFGGGSRKGLLDRDTAWPDWETAEVFTQAGIRTYRILAIIKLNQLVVRGEKIDLEEAVRRDIVDEDFVPVVAVRAFGARARVEDLVTKYIEADSRVWIDDAKQLVAKEFGRGALSDEEYACWFAKTLGENVGLMHKNDWYHSYLTSHNITLDCRIVDLDSVTKLQQPSQWASDFDAAANTLSIFRSALNSMTRSSLNCDLYRIYYGAYLAVFRDVPQFLLSHEKKAVDREILHHKKNALFI